MKKSLGFSLLEMMVVLLIVSILAALAAPIVNKRFVAKLNTEGEHFWTQFDNGIFHTPETDKTVSIGTDRQTTQKESLRLQSLDVEPKLTLGVSEEDIISIFYNKENSLVWAKQAPANNTKLIPAKAITLNSIPK